MNKIETDFRVLVGKSGAFAQLDLATKTIRKILSNVLLSEKEGDMLIHKGLLGEYGNGLYFSFYKAQNALQKDNEASLEESIEALFTTFEKPSQLTLLKTESDKISAEAAFPIQISIATDWVFNAFTITPDEKIEMLAALDQCEKQFSKIKAFKDQCPSLVRQVA